MHSVCIQLENTRWILKYSCFNTLCLSLCTLQKGSTASAHPRPLPLVIIWHRVWQSQCEEKQAGLHTGWPLPKGECICSGYTNYVQKIILARDTCTKTSTLAEHIHFLNVFLTCQQKCCNNALDLNLRSILCLITKVLQNNYLDGALYKRQLIIIIKTDWISARC